MHEYYLDNMESIDRKAPTPKGGDMKTIYIFHAVIRNEIKKGEDILESPSL